MAEGASMTERQRVRVYTGCSRFHEVFGHFRAIFADEYLMNKQMI